MIERNVMGWTVQAGDKRVCGRPGAGPITTRRDASDTRPGSGIPTSSYQLLAHHSRLRRSGHHRRHDGRPELSLRDDQERRQTLSAAAVSRRPVAGRVHDEGQVGPM